MKKIYYANIKKKIEHNLKGENKTNIQHFNIKIC